MAINGVAIGNRPLYIGPGDQITIGRSGGIWTLKNTEAGEEMQVQAYRTGEGLVDALTFDPDTNVAGRAGIAGAIDISRQATAGVIQTSDGATGVMRVHNLNNGHVLRFEATDSGGIRTEIGYCEPDDIMFRTPSIRHDILAISSDATGLDTVGHSIMSVDASGGNVTINSLAGGVEGKVLYVYRIDNSGNTVTITHNYDGGPNSIVLRGASNKTLFGYWGTRLVYIAGFWRSDIFN